MLKEKSKTWEKFSQQLGVIFERYPLSPNFYTWMTIPFAVLGFTAMVYQHIGTGIILFIIAGLLDLVDGALARKRGISSGYGAFLDGSVDRLVDFLVIFSYFWLPIAVPWLGLGEWIAIVVFLAIMPSFEVAYANHRRAVYDPEEKRIWRILNRGEMYTLMLLIPLLAQFNPHWAGYVLVILVILSAITSLQTFFITLHLSKTETHYER